MDGFENNEREVMLPMEDAAVPKPVNPEFVADVLAFFGADIVNAGNAKPKVALVKVVTVGNVYGIVVAVNEPN